MREYKEHLILKGSNIKQALSLLNKLAPDSILFVVDQEDKLIGSLTDGDIRRGFLKDNKLINQIDDIIQPNPHYVRKGESNLTKIINYREAQFKILPIVDENMRVVNVINFRYVKSYLPIDVVIMAGGRGQRLKPLTDTIPKPLLKVGSKPILEHNLDRLTSYGIDDFWISVKYLGKQIEKYFGDGEERNIKIQYIWEAEPLGTIGAVSKIKNLAHDIVLVTNSDLLCNLNYEDFYLDFINKEADFSVVTIPYQINVPYAVLETLEGRVKSLREKPTFTYYSNGGIYLMKRELIRHIPENSFFNSTDLMEYLVAKDYNVVSYPFSGYWLDMGNHEDFEKAQIDVINLK